MWKPDMSAVVCDESFRECAWSLPSDGKPFGPERATEAVPPRSRQLVAEVARLTRSGRQAMLDAGPLDLVLERSLRIPAGDGKKLVIGGQYLRVPGRTKLRVELDLQVAGEGVAVEFHQDVFLNGYSQFVRDGIIVREGERWRLRYDVHVPGSSGQLVVQLYATTIEGEVAEVQVHEAQLAMIEEPIESSSTVVLRDEVSRTPTR